MSDKKLYPSEFVLKDEAGRVKEIDENVAAKIKV